MTENTEIPTRYIYSIKGQLTGTSTEYIMQALIHSLLVYSYQSSISFPLLCSLISDIYSFLSLGAFHLFLPCYIGFPFGCSFLVILASLLVVNTQLPLDRFTLVLLVPPGKKPHIYNETQVPQASSHLALKGCLNPQK